jgi:hypothetical protein
MTRKKTHKTGGKTRPNPTLPRTIYHWEERKNSSQPKNKTKHHKHSPYNKTIHVKYNLRDPKSIHKRGTVKSSSAPNSTSNSKF